MTAPAAERARVWPAALALAVGAVAQAVPMKFLVEKLPSGGGPPLGSVIGVALSLAAVSLASWFMRTTALEVLFDFKRRQRNMRPLLRATGFAAAGIAGVTALWGGAALLLKWHSVWVILVPMLLLWTVRTVLEAHAVSRLYDRNIVLAFAVAAPVAVVTLVLAFVALCFVETDFGRVAESFRG